MEKLCEVEREKGEGGRQEENEGGIKGNEGEGRMGKERRKERKKGISNISRNWASCPCSLAGPTFPKKTAASAKFIP